MGPHPRLQSECLAPNLDPGRLAVPTAPITPAPNAMTPKFLSLLCALAWVAPTVAQTPLTGDLTATRDCPATVSIKQRDPAGSVRLEPGRAYRLLGKNKPQQATHYQVVIDGASPAERWVEVGCGTIPGEARTDAKAPSDAAASDSPRGMAPGARPAPVPTPAQAQAQSKPGAFVLALSWQPAFCELHKRKDECRDQTAERPDASRFSLHGLWPQPRYNTYCGVDARTRRLDQEGDWTALPDLDLKPATRERLSALMPGARSGLQQHEWTTHGTCYGTDPDTYFRQALDLTEQVNASRVRALFQGRRGRHVSATEVRAAFHADFGRGAGDRVRLVCEEGMVSEIRLSLKGTISEGSRIGPLMQAGPSLSNSCQGGRVDEAGFE
jgi:ribonuclease T2